MATVLEPSIARGPAPESSDRGFGFVFAAVFAIIGCWPLLHWQSPRWWALGVAVAFAARGRRAAATPASAQPRLVPARAAAAPGGEPAGHGRRVLPLRHADRPGSCGCAARTCCRLRRRPDLSSYWIVREPRGRRARNDEASSERSQPSQDPDVVSRRALGSSCGCARSIGWCRSCWCCSSSAA